MSKALNFGVTLLIFVTLFTTVVMTPAPPSFFAPSILALIAFSGVALLLIFWNKMEFATKFDDYNTCLRFSFLLYLIYLLISFAIGLLSLESPMAVLRSTGPYVMLLPFLPLVCLRRYQLDFDKIAWIFIVCGLFQALHCIDLYFSLNKSFGTVIRINETRITIMDPRTTVSLMLASSIIPLYYFFHPLKKPLVRYLALAIVIVSTLGIILTYTRSMFLAVVGGWLVYFGLLFSYGAKNFKIPRRLLLLRLSLFILMILLLFWLVNQLQSMHYAFQAFSTRIGGINRPDYSDGRIYAEWIPVLKTWWNANLFNQIFGIGSGVSFHMLSGEPRTYVHNLILYSLLYGGIFGLIAVLCVYCSMLYSLLRKAIVEIEPIYFIFIAFLFAQFFYTELFAVHKIFSYNLMFIILLGICFRAKKSALQRTIK